jgi:hypothetical protein
MRKRTLALSVMFGAVLVLLGATGAAAQVAEDAGPGDQLQPLLTIDQWLVLLGMVVPFATAVIKRFGAPDWVSSLITLVLSASVSFVVELLQAGDLTFDRWRNGAIQVGLTALVTWFFASDPISWLNRRVPGGIGPLRTGGTIEPTGGQVRVRHANDGVGGAD